MTTPDATACSNWNDEPAVDMHGVEEPIHLLQLALCVHHVLQGPGQQLKCSCHLLPCIAQPMRFLREKRQDYTFWC